MQIRIASLQPVGAGSSLVRVATEGGEALRIHERRLTCPWLTAGGIIGEPELDTLRGWAAADAAEQRALRLLAVRGRSRAELLSRMSRWGVDEASAEEVLSRLAAYGAVDDAALAESVVASRRRTGHGRLRARADLQRLSVDEAAAGAALAEPDGGEQELARARRELERRYGGRPTDRRGLARAAAHLARRGFDCDTVAEALGLDLLDEITVVASGIRHGSCDGHSGGSTIGR